ncbi:MAG: RNA polymerase sigma factor RpoD, partial [Desulfobacteraceae bacterium]|nr:RNA polymerase sigma factor RpoD [Desulfobacteraceae bacterium]
MAKKIIESDANKLIGEKEFKKLIKKGKKDGSLSYAEINQFISDDLVSSDQLDDIVVHLEGLGIELIDREKEKRKKPVKAKKSDKKVKKVGRPRKSDTKDTKVKKAKKDSKKTAKAKTTGKKVKKTKKSEKAGKKPAKPTKAQLAKKASSSDADFGTVTDPVKMYLREMGMVTLLSREGEIEIAKKIESGERDILRVMLDTPLAVGVIFIFFEGLRVDKFELNAILRDLHEGNNPEENIKQEDFVEVIKKVEKIHLENQK